MPVVRWRTELDHPPDEVFAWHGRPGVFERLTPPWESVRVLERSGGLESGARVRLGLRKGPVELRWEVEHTDYEPGRRFVDEQVAGPFARWRHEHRFRPSGAAGTTVEDVIEWDPPLGALGEAFSNAYVRRSLERLLAFRGRRLRDDLGLLRRYGRGEGRTVAVTGATGLIGRPLVDFLRAAGYRVLRISRSAPSGPPADAPRPPASETIAPETIAWNPESAELDGSALEGLYGVVHLAGEPIAGVRWTRAKKQAILRSREQGTLLLSRTLAELDRRPQVLVSASGVDYYGARGEERLSEADASGDTFLAEVCRRWEQSTHAARAMGIRTVHLRSGPVLSPAGGMLGTILLPFRLGLGGRVGSGRQYVSWIDLDDEIGLILHALSTADVRGPMNATSPGPVPNAAFSDVLGRVLGRPTVVPAPALAVRALLGEMGSELILTGARAVPEQALETGYRFLYPDLEESLRHQLGRTDAAQGSHASA